MEWQFRQEPGPPHRWRWQCIEDDTGSVLKISHNFFPTLSDCIEDAELHGYRPVHAHGDSDE